MIRKKVLTNLFRYAIKNQRNKERKPLGMWRFKIGAVVHFNTKLNQYAPEWGHVTGFGINAIGQINVKVKWSNGDEYCIHPSLLETEPETQGD